MHARRQPRCRVGHGRPDSGPVQRRSQPTGPTVRSSHGHANDAAAADLADTVPGSGCAEPDPPRGVTSDALRALQ